MEIFYGPEEAPEAKELGQKSLEATTSLGGAPLGRAPWLVDSSGTPDFFLMPKIPINI